MSKHPSPPTPSRIRGTVVAFNFSPKGHREGVVVQTPTGLTQVNFPKDPAELLARTTHLGSTVDLVAEADITGGDHPVYRATAPGSDVTGTVARLNFALHGEVNGYQLDDGTFLHVRPDGARRYRFNVGDRVRASGPQLHGPAAMVVEVHDAERLTKHHDGALAT